MKPVSVDDHVRVADCYNGMRPGELRLYGDEERTREPLELVLTFTEDGAHARIGGENYVLERLERTNVCLPGTPSEFSLTIITATCRSRADTGAMLIEVDCAREPPVLSIAARFETARPQSWSWTIDHHVQHRVLEHLQVCELPIAAAVSGTSWVD